MFIIVALSIVAVLVIAFRFRKKNGNEPSVEKRYKPVSRSGMKEAKYSGDMFSSKRVESEVEVSSAYIQEDFLGKAANAGQKAKKAMKLKNFDEAWGLFHEQKSLYIQHANRSGFTANQALALDATVHEEMANILRQEGKHNDALVHIVYWVLAGSERRIKRHDQKLQAYFNRCKFQKVPFELAKENMAKLKMPVSFLDAKSIVSDWVDAG
ncbi:hypothetical protein EXT46_03360 [Pseudoalteromonas sp. CO325X]|uniref:hypothetical protein n=1 Tax=Pseudoalteromonas sp. CO325X TaxID=1777262 RepID=UPI0010230A9C|nr:hypothetical protein [Pseudoalteromonas sp. CO325X]RZF84367.1 hypothetical protein EXT46_03360 [Pseudoalteromonas sp. CO325X]